MDTGHPTRVHCGRAARNGGIVARVENTTRMVMVPSTGYNVAYKLTHAIQETSATLHRKELNATVFQSLAYSC